MVSIRKVKDGSIDPVLNNLINRVDNIETPTIDELKELLRHNAKLLEIKTDGGDVIAHFFTDIQGDTLILECMLGKGKEGIDPCKVLLLYAEEVCKHRGLKRIRINTKRGGVVRKFIGLGFNLNHFVIEKEV